MSDKCEDFIRTHVNTDLYEEEAEAGSRMVVYMKGQEDNCSHDDHHCDDCCQEANLQLLLTLS